MDKHAAEQAVILIPSLEPDGRLPAYIQELKKSGFAHIVVVDDGSGEAFRPIFDEVSAVEDTVVLRHEVNKGKGVALKTGYRYIMENLPDTPHARNHIDDKRKCYDTQYQTTDTD